ncbi:diguanylate cyclase domain-containing protein [Bacterioplanoides sp. SCSIO 12839]|uniref:diguanylate cyclase domain-containing protein n=1 Tax=Bacterioplanoides sp. SCSIO 12839 TaxID=2829569 RepID=UPI00210637B9|nr:diguanylate cyclase [Bacterioplanoides sp. SCSIO 12839]UTW49838.1 diguanylate cyclase [Bacterioplanoides sp. SCSIO 12839]
MSNNKLIIFVAVTVFLSFPLLWLLQDSSNISIVEGNKRFTALAKFRQHHASLSEAVLRVRTGMDQNYDHLSQIQYQTDQYFTVLEQLFMHEDAAQQHLQRVQELHQQRLNAIEGFKSTQARLANSLRFLPVLQQQLLSDSSSIAAEHQYLTAQISLNLTNYRSLSDQSSIHQGKHLLSQLSSRFPDDNNAVNHFITHAHKLLEFQQQESGYLSQILSSPLSEELESLAWQLQKSHTRKLLDSENLKSFMILYSGILALMVVAFIVNRYQLRQSLSEKTIISEKDQLTGLHNRRYFMSQLKSSLQQPTASGALIFIDLDGFKAVNDQMGHHHGDIVLCQIAKRLEGYCLSSTRTGITLSRLGGDEFVLLIPTLHDSNTDSDIELMCQQLISLLNEPLPYPYDNFSLSGSLGVAFYPQHGITVTDIMHAADQAMYHAKKMGKNTYHLHQRHPI